MNEQDYILFESYLSNELSDEAVSDFESRLKTDTEFQEAFNIYKDTVAFLKHKFEYESASRAFQDHVTQISDEHFKKAEGTKDYQTSPKNLRYFKFALVASVVLLFGIFMFNQYSQPEYTDYANYGTISLTVRGNNDALLQTAQNAFNTKDFSKADDALKSLIVLDDTNAELKLYRAIANIELDNFDVAEELLINIQKGNSVYKHKATWYLALSMLKQEEYTACVEILQAIPEDAEDYNRAQELIRKLD